jgi:hypothetical protein
MALKSLITAFLTCSIFALAGDQSTTVVSSLVVHDMNHGAVKIEAGASRATVVIFISAICPMSFDYGGRIAKLTKDYASRNVRVLLVNSNLNEPDEQVEEYRNNFKLAVPVYRDPGGEVAGILHAFSTPTAVMLDRNGAVRYWGSIDDNRNLARATKQYLRQAIGAILAGKSVEPSRTRVLGCSIKAS